jgi:hypothetical protein
MKQPRLVLYSLLLVVGCLLAPKDIGRAQGHASAPFLELKTCDREVKVFEDGKVFESRDGKKTDRQLSSDRLRTLREILANPPCPLQWQQTLPVQGSSDSKLGDLEVTLGMVKQCHVPLIASGSRPPGSNKWS